MKYRDMIKILLTFQVSQNWVLNLF